MLKVRAAGLGLAGSALAAETAFAVATLATETAFTVAALAPDGSRALLRCDPELPVSADLVIDIGGMLYAKVTGLEKGCAVLCFTSKPESFGAWFRNLSGSAE